MNISDDFLRDKIRFIIGDDEIHINSILYRLNELNPTHEYIDTHEVAEINFVKDNFRYAVLNLKESYHDLIKVSDFVFKTTQINPIISDETFTHPNAIALDLCRDELIEHIKNLFPRKNTKLSYIKNYYDFFDILTFKTDDNYVIYSLRTMKFYEKL